MLLKEDHPLAFNLSFSISLGLLPTILSLKTTGCGIKSTAEQTGDDEQSSKLYLILPFPCFFQSCLMFEF